MGADHSTDSGKAILKESIRETLLRSTGVFDLRHVYNGLSGNLGDPCTRQYEAGSHAARRGVGYREVRLRHTTVDPSNDRGGQGRSRKEECKWG